VQIDFAELQKYKHHFSFKFESVVDPECFRVIIFVRQQVERDAFRDLHVRYPIEMLLDAKASGVIGGHDEMPMFDLGLTDMKALLTYIDRLNPDVPGYAGLVPDRAP